MYDPNQEAEDPFKNQDLIKEEEDEESILTRTEDKFYTESVRSSEVDLEGLDDLDVDHGNTISSIKIDKFRMQK